MKHIHFFLPALLILSSTFLLTSCSNGDPASPVQNIIENNVKSGTWIITSFIDSGKDETDHFTGYAFTFTANGTITASNGSNTMTGTWNLSDNSSNDDSPDDIDFNIMFSPGNDFEELNEDWHIITQSSDRIELIHVSGGNGGTDYLTFEKN